MSLREYCPDALRSRYAVKLFTIALLIVLVIGTAGAVMVTQVSERVTNEQLRSVESNAELEADQLARWFEGEQGSIRVFSARQGIEPADPALTRQTLTAELANRSGEVASLHVAERATDRRSNGTTETVVASTNPAVEGEPLAETNIDWGENTDGEEIEYAFDGQGDVLVSWVYLDEGNMSVAMASPTPGGEHVLIGEYHPSVRIDDSTNVIDGSETVVLGGVSAFVMFEAESPNEFRPYTGNRSNTEVGRRILDRNDQFATLSGSELGNEVVRGYHSVPSDGLLPTPGLVFGHEPVGRIVEVGNTVTAFSEGDLVTNPFNLSDGSCRYCKAGRANICERSVPMGFVRFQPGAFAEEYPVRNADQNLVAVPTDAADPAEIAGLGCRFATAFHGVSRRADMSPGDWVAVHGCGGVGLSAVHVASALGGNVIAIDIIEEKLDKALELGATETIDSTEVADVPQGIKAITDGSRGVEVSVEALGIAQTVQDSVNCLAPGGQHIQLGLTTSEEGGEVSVPVDNIVWGEREFIGSYGMPPHEYDRIFRMMDGGKIEPGRVISETCALDDIPGVMERMGEFETMGIPVCTEF